MVLVHAGIADRRMWDGVWAVLANDRPALRLDLRGFGESTRRPSGTLDHAADLLATLDAAAIGRAHLIGVSLGAGVVVEAALAKPSLAASLLLVAPGGSLIAGPTDELRAFWRAEGEALERGDLDAAVEANLRTWLDGRGGRPADVPGTVRRRVGEMQRLAFETAAGWGDVEEHEPDPPVVERLGELRTRTLVLVGDRDLDAITAAAERVQRDVAGSRLVRWPRVAHLPPLERPAAFAALLRDWMAEAEAD